MGRRTRGRELPGQPRARPSWYFGAHHPPEEAEQLTDEVLNLPNVIFGFLVPGPFPAIVGTVVLMFVLWRAEFVRWWVPLVFTGGWVGSFVGPYGPATIPFWLATSAVLTYLGARIFGMDDHVYAAFSGPRPAVGPGADGVADHRVVADA